MRYKERERALFEEWLRGLKLFGLGVFWDGERERYSSPEEKRYPGFICADAKLVRGLWSAWYASACVRSTSPEGIPSSPEGIPSSPEGIPSSPEGSIWILWASFDSCDPCGPNLVGHYSSKEKAEEAAKQGNFASFEVRVSFEEVKLDQPVDPDAGMPF